MKSYSSDVQETCTRNHMKKSINPDDEEVISHSCGLEAAKETQVDSSFTLQLV